MDKAGDSALRVQVEERVAALRAARARMGKRLNEDSQAPHGGKHRAAFIALRRFIEGALADGYTMKATWTALCDEKKLSMSHQTFRMHCQRAKIGQGAVATAADDRPEPPSASGAAMLRTGIAGAAGAPERGFRHERMPRRLDIYG